jgi:hypothetical protein
MANAIFDALFKVDHSQVDKGTEAVKKMGKETDHAAEAGEHLETIFAGMGGAVGEAVEHISRFNNTIGKMLESMEHLATLNVKTISGLGEIGSALLAGTAAAAAFAVVLGAVGIAMAFEWAEKIEQANNLGVAFGYSATQAMLMQMAAQKAGSSLEAVEGVYTKVAKAAWNANDPLKGTGAAFHQLGLEVKDHNGVLKSATELTEEAIHSWEHGTQSTADFAAMTQVLGKGWEKNLPALEAINDAQKTSNELTAEGIGISTESIHAVEENTKANTRMHGIMSDVGSKLVEIVVPAFTNLVQWFNRSYESGGLVAGVFGAIEGATWLLMVAIKVLMTLLQSLDLIMTAVGKAIGAVAASLMMLANRDLTGAKNVWVEYFADIKKSAEDTGTSIAHLWEAHDGHTVAANKSGNKSNGGGDTKQVVVKGAVGEATDMYLKYLTTLEKVLEREQHLNEEQKAGEQLKRLDIEFAKEKAKIEEENNKIAKDGGTLKATYSTAELERIAKEIAAIKEKSKAIDEQTRQNLVSIELTKKLNDTAFSYNQSIIDEIHHKHMAVEAIKEEAEIRKIEKATLDTITKLKQDNIWTIDAETAAYQKQADAIAKVHKSTQTLIDANKDWLNNGIDGFVTGLGTMEKGLEKITTTGLQNFSDTLYSLITTGKNGFAGMVSSMLDQIAKLIFQIMVVTPMINAMKAAMNSSGGIGGLFSGLFGGGGAASSGAGAAVDASVVMAAEGAVIGANGNNGQSILVGERGPERWTPKGAGTITPTNQLSSGSTGSMNIVNNITITSQGDNSKPEDQQKLARTIVTMIDQRFNDNMAKANRPGGSNNKVSMQIG